jgi:hypothetical protein
MSRLYSSPESYAVALESYAVVSASPERGRTEAHRITVSFHAMSSISPTIAFNKDAFPNRRHALPAGPIIQPAKTSLINAHDGFAWRYAAQVFMLRKSSCCVNLQAQYQAFVRFAVESSTASAIALNWTCVLEPFTRRALVSRTLASPVPSYGASNPGPTL